MLKVTPQDRALLIEPLYTTTMRFWLLVGGLAALVGWGGYMYGRQLVFGLGETNLNRPVFWGIYMVNFIFLIGVSMAGTLISSALLLTGANWRRPITRIAETLTVFGLLIAGLQILFDMGRPDQLVAMVRYGRMQSPLMWDAISMSMYIMVSMIALYFQLLPDIALLRDNVPEGSPAWRSWLYTWLALGWRGSEQQWLKLERILTWISLLIIPIGISLHTVTSWIFSTTVQPGWKSTILGPYFVVGAIFSGIGLLFLVMTLFRQVLHLQPYIERRHYQNLGGIFIVMSGTWFYFTYTEYLTLIAEQEVTEFPLLASKLWGEFAPTFWGMVALMVVATWFLVVPRLMPRRWRAALALPMWQRAVFFLLAILNVLVLVGWPERVPDAFGLTGAQWVTVLWWVEGGLVGLIIVGSTAWFIGRFPQATIVASACVVVGMWLERWNIIIPTLTHPRLIPYDIYVPSMTETAITIGSFALLALLVVVFFKLFPVISIWEVAEGRVIEAAEAKIDIPRPELSNEGRRLGFRGIRRNR